jgi:hypothetical protein
MALTIAQAMEASQNPYQTAMFRQIATSDYMFSMIPFVPKAGEGFSFEREVSNGSFASIAPGGSVSESTGRTEKVTVSNREFAADFYIPNFAQSLMSDRVSQIEQQTMMKLKAAGLALSAKMITGSSISTTFTSEAFQSGAYVDALVQASPFIRERNGAGELKYTHSGTLLQFRAPGDPDFGTAVACAADGNYTLASYDPSKWITVTLDVSDATADAIRRIEFTATNDFDGLQYQVTSGQTRDASSSAGDALSLPILEELIDAVKNRSGQLAFVMNSKLRRKYTALVRAAGGTPPDFIMDGPLGKFTLPSFNGIPILVNDNIPSTETGASSGTTLSSVYLANFGPGDGVYMAAFGGGSQQVQADPRDTTVLGFQILELGQKQGESKLGRRLLWFGAMCCGSDLSLARAKRIVTA